MLSQVHFLCLVLQSNAKHVALSISYVQYQEHALTMETDMHRFVSFWVGNDDPTIIDTFLWLMIIQSLLPAFISCI